MRETLRFPAGCDGQVWLHQPGGRLHHWHRHDEPEFNLVLRGTATYVLEGRRCDLVRHGMVWLFPRQEHVLVDPSPDLALWIGVVRPAALLHAIGSSGGYAELLSADPPGGHCRVMPPADAAFLDRICRDLSSCADLTRLNAGLPYLFLAAWDCFRQADAIVDHDVHPGLRRACAILAADPGLSAADLAALAGVSRFHLVRMFRAQLGTTVLAWRSRLRVERALALRRAAPGRGWTGIALDSGFGSYAQFHRAFTAALGVPPRCWVEDPAPRRPAPSRPG